MADGNKGPEKIADVLGRLFTSRGWGRKNDRLRLEAAWAEAAGAELLKETRVLGLQARRAGGRGQKRGADGGADAVPQARPAWRSSATRLPGATADRPQVPRGGVVGI